MPDYLGDDMRKGKVEEKEEKEKDIKCMYLIFADCRSVCLLFSEQ